MTRFYVTGRPAPKGSRTVARGANGKTWSRPASKYEKPWIAAVSSAASQHPKLAPPYLVELVFFFERPKKPTNDYPVQDVDKLARSTLDGLVVGGLLEDDRHVTRLVAVKAWGEASGCEVTVTAADPTW